MNATTFLQVGGTAFKAFLVFLLPLAALLFVAHGNIGTIIKKPRLGDIPLILIVTALVFGLTHYAAYGSIVQILLVQGLGCIIDVFAYLKTKNILTSYAAHLLLDLIPLGLAALGAL